MPLQNLSPLNRGFPNQVTRSTEPWLELKPGQAWMKVLWVGPETGRWAAIFRWSQGYVAERHKHLSDAHTFVLKGRMRGPDGVIEAGDYAYDPCGAVHEATTALEDTEYLFVCEGPMLHYDDAGLTRYVGWEEIELARQRARQLAAAR